MNRLLKEAIVSKWIFNKHQLLYTFPSFLPLLPQSLHLLKLLFNIIFEIPSNLLQLLILLLLLFHLTIIIIRFQPFCQDDHPSIEFCCEWRFLKLEIWFLNWRENLFMFIFERVFREYRGEVLWFVVWGNEVDIELNVALEDCGEGEGLEIGMVEGEVLAE